MPMLPDIQLDDYQYDLPDEYIARYPAAPRDSSRLLIYQNDTITHAHFQRLPDHLPDHAFLVFNDTKVIPARIYFRKPSGALIEVFLLHPEAPTRIIYDVMQQTESCVWNCMVGNKKRWKAGEVLRAELRMTNGEVGIGNWEFGIGNDELRIGNGGGGEYELRIEAEWVDVEKNWVKFSWQPVHAAQSSFAAPSFAEVIRRLGEIPLPPYLNRKAEKQDSESYQTVYSKTEGAVAAPTAGLHFTERVFEKLAGKGIEHDFVTLHVGAGTFQPVKVQRVTEHAMHAEQVVFTLEFVEKLLHHLGKIVAVGTTSVRALESLYWYGVGLLQGSDTFWIEKLSPYQSRTVPSAKESLKAVIGYMREKNKTEVVGETEILIMPGYDFKLCEGLITNFHQPGSTLMLLVAALVGEDWKNIYAEALANHYRFLSYGDSSLLWRTQTPFGRNKGSGHD